MEKVLLLLFSSFVLVSCSDDTASVIAMDGIKPVYKIISPAEGDTLKYSTTIMLNVDWPIPIDSCMVGVNSNSFTVKYNLGVDVSSSYFVNGQNILTIQIKDIYGNKSEIKTRKIYYEP
jgi:hypothetical protein